MLINFNVIQTVVIVDVFLDSLGGREGNVRGWVMSRI